MHLDRVRNFSASFPKASQHVSACVWRELKTRQVHPGPSHIPAFPYPELEEGDIQGSLKIQDTPDALVFNPVLSLLLEPDLGHSYSHSLAFLVAAIVPVSRTGGTKASHQHTSSPPISNSVITSLPPAMLIRAFVEIFFFFKKRKLY